MANKILQIDLQNDITPQIGSYDNTGGVTPNNWLNESGVHSLGPTNVDGRTPYYWFTPTREVTDFDLCWEDYQDHSQTTAQYHLEIGDSAGNVVLSVFRSNNNYSIGPVGVGNLAYQTWHKMLVEVRKASASSSTVTAYVDGKKIASGTSDTLLTSAKIALLGHVPGVGHWQNAGQRLRYVTIYDRSYSSKGVNLDGIMTTITGFINKLKGALSTVAFSGSYNDLSDKPTISTVNDGTLTIQQNGTNVQTFTANASTNKTANIQCVDLSTAQTISGVKTFTSNMVIQGGKKVTCNLDNSFIELDGGTTWGKGGSIVLSGQDRSSYTNSVLIVSKSDTNTDILQYQNGELKPHQNNTNNSSLGTSTNKWAKVYSDDVVHTTGNETIGGIKVFYTPATPYPIIKLKTAFIEQGLYDSDNLRGIAFRCTDKNDAILGDFGYKAERTGEVGSYFSARTKVNNTQTTREVKLRFKPGSSDCELVPDTTNLIDFGSSNYQWNNAYIKNYYYNGVAWGLDKANVWTDTNTFSKTNSDAIRLKNGRVAIGETISGDAYTQLVFQDKNTDNLAYIRNMYATDGANTLDFFVRNKYTSGSPSTTGSVVYSYFGLSLDNTGKTYARLKGDFYPYTNNTYSLGSSSYQWDNAYIKSLTINGVACGDILTHNASEFVGVTGAQTISGNKTFIGRLTYKATNTIAGDSTSSNFAGSFNFIDKNDVQIGMLGLNVFNNNGYTEQVLNIINPLWFNDNTKTKSFAVRLRVMHETEEVSFTPSKNNTINLGSTSYKWKSFNGIAPDELGLPTSSYTDVSSYITNFDSTPNTFTAPVSGFLNIVTDYTGDIACSVFNTTTGIQIGGNDTLGQVRILLPLEQGNTITVYINKSGLSLARIYHLKGKV